MATIRLHRNALFGEPEVYTTDEQQSLVEWLAKHAKEVGEQGAVIIFNGVEIADSSKHDDMLERTSVQMGLFDQVDIYVRPADPVTAIAVTVAVVAAGVAIALAPKPKIPNDVGENSTSPNNQLSAANNEFRPRQAIPDIAGEIVAYPDFVQISYYVYEANRRKFTELLCIGEGEYDIADVKDGETLFDDLPASDYTIYGPTDTVPAEFLLDVREVEASIDLPLPAADDNTRSAQIIDGRFTLNENVNLGQSGAQIIDDLDLQIGDTVDLDVTYTASGTPASYSGTHTITNVNPFGIITVSPDTLPFTDPGSVNGQITKTSGSSIGQWFTLEGDAIEEVRFQLKMPRGLRKADGTNGTVGFTCEVEELDGTGTPTGNTTTQGGNFTANTQEVLFQTKFIDSLTPSRYRARVYRTTNSLGNDAADLLVCEKIESVTPYTDGFGDVTLILAQRASAATQSRGASTKINLLATRKLELFDPETGTYASGVYTATRSFAQYVMYLLRRAGVPVSQIDYQSLFAIETSLTDAQLGYFDFSFDDRNISLRDRLETCCNAARVKYYNVGNIYKFVREESQPVSSALFCRRNVVPRAARQDFQMFVANDFDSIELKYVDPVENVDAYIRRRINPSTGAIEAGLGDNVQEIKLAGCRNSLQATNRAELEIRRIKYQRYKIKDVTLSDALNVGVGKRITWCDINDSKVQTGEILSFDGNIYETSEQIDFSEPGNYYCYITDESGAVSNSVVIDSVSGNPYAFEAFGTLTAYTADGYEKQLGSMYFIVNENELSRADFMLTARGAPNELGEVEIEASKYTELLFEED